MNGSSYGNLSAIFYDLDKPNPPEDELEFYLSYAKYDMKILEAMCGSGRFLLQLARRGYNIDGFDQSQEMLSQCALKLTQERLDSALANCDFENFVTEKKYDLIFIGGASFPLVVKDADIEKSLVKLRGLLNKDGILLVSIEQNTELSCLVSEIDEYEFFSNELSEWKRVCNGEVEIVLKGKSSYNAFKGILYSYMIYELYESDSFVRDEHEDFYLKIYKNGEFERRVLSCGFTIKNIYRNYDKMPYNGDVSDCLIYELAIEI